MKVHRAWLACFLFLALPPGCAEPATYNLNGSFSHDPSDDEQQWFSRALEGANRVDWLLSSPPGFAAFGMTLPDCERSQQNLRALSFIQSVGECRAAIT